MHNVIILVEDERRKLQVCTTGPDPGRYMCRMRTVTEIRAADKMRQNVFSYTVLPLLVPDPKIDQYVTECDGAVVVLSYISLEKNPDTFIKRIQSLRCRPMLVLIEDSPPPQQLPPASMQYDYIYPSSQAPPAGSGVKHYIQSTDEFLHVSYISNPEDRISAYEHFCELLWRSESLPRKPKVLSSKEMSTESLVSQFNERTLPISAWDHYGRLRIVTYSLKKYGYEATIQPDGWLCTTWRAYKTSIGHGNLWNYSLTRFWANILWSILQKQRCKFSEMWERYPVIQNGSLHKDYYSSVIFTPRAKEGWVPPDLVPTPAPSSASAQGGCAVS